MLLAQLGGLQVPRPKYTEAFRAPPEHRPAGALYRWSVAAGAAALSYFLYRVLGGRD